MKFSSPEHALKWTFETSSKPLGDSDMHAQAALILALCERVLPTLHMAYVRIQFGRDRCGSDVLAYHLAANFGTGVHSRRSIDQIIRAYCGERIGLREIRASLRCGMLKAVSLRNRSYDALDAIHVQAMDRLRMEMDSRGMLITIRPGDLDEKEETERELTV